jgi:hypothetical protein
MVRTLMPQRRAMADCDGQHSPRASARRSMNSSTRRAAGRKALRSPRSSRSLGTRKKPVEAVELVQTRRGATTGADDDGL